VGDFLYSIDKSLFIFINQTLANPVFDLIMRPITDWNQSWFGWGIFAVLWLLLFWKGGRKGRTVCLLLIPMIGITDQFSSTYLKYYFQRPRPCHEINGVAIIQNIHLLVPCGSGYSFPSSHAANNFALAGFASYYYRRWTWAYFLYAGIMGFSRISVGVHYPSDVLGGAFIGICCATLWIFLWEAVSRHFHKMLISEPLLKERTRND
jgi:undecaprenyl-diphosphatase